MTKHDPLLSGFRVSILASAAAGRLMAVKRGRDRLRDTGHATDFSRCRRRGHRLLLPARRRGRAALAPAGGLRPVPGRSRGAPQEPGRLRLQPLHPGRGADHARAPGPLGPLAAAGGAGLPRAGVCHRRDLRPAGSDAAGLRHIQEKEMEWESRRRHGRFVPSGAPGRRCTPSPRPRPACGNCGRWPTTRPWNWQRTCARCGTTRATSSVRPSSSWRWVPANHRGAGVFRRPGAAGPAVVRDPTAVRRADVLLIESTYGNRLHRSLQDTEDELVSVLQEVLHRPAATSSSPPSRWGAPRRFSPCWPTWCATVASTA